MDSTGSQECDVQLHAHFPYCKRKKKFQNSYWTKSKKFNSSGIRSDFIIEIEPNEKRAVSRGKLVTKMIIIYHLFIFTLFVM